MIQAVLLDIDDTLLDFGQAARLSIQEGFARLGFPFTEKVMAVFTQVNDELWQRLERGELTREGIYHVRWTQIFQRLGLSFDGPAFDRAFRQQLARQVCPVDGALPLVQYLSARYVLCAASNGPYSQQLQRLGDAGMLPYFHHLFISEQLGCAKPARAFYDRCFAALAPIGPNESILIGDSPTADVAGGLAYGIHTCWFNPKGRPLPQGCRPDYEISRLDELMDIL